MSDRAQQEIYWETLSRGGDLDARLQALEELELFVEPGGQLENKLSLLSRSLRGPLEKAVFRVLLGVRRRARHREVLTAGSNSRIGEHRINRSLQHARSTLKEGDARSRQNFLKGLVRKEFFEVGPALVAHCLREKDHVVLATLAVALGYLASEGSVRMLERLARHETKLVRLGVVQGLAYQSGRQAVVALLERLADTEEEVRDRALEVLASVAGTEIMLAYEGLASRVQIEVGLGLEPLLLERKASPSIQALLRSMARSREPELRDKGLSLLSQAPL